MKTKILSLAIALMMLVSIATSMPVGAIVYDNNDIILDVMDLTADDTSIDLTKKRYKTYVPVGENKPTWTTNGCMSINKNESVRFTFNVSKAGTYRVLAATSNGSNVIAKMDAALYDNGSVTESICGETTVGIVVIDGAAKVKRPVATDLDYVTLTEGEHTLRIRSKLQTFYLYNVKLEYVGDDFTVCNNTGIDITEPAATWVGDKKPADDLGWLPSSYVGVAPKTILIKDVKVVKDGDYDLYLGARQYSSTSTAPEVSVNVDGEDVATGVSFTAGETAAETKIAERIPLKAGTAATITLTFSGTDTMASVYGFKLQLAEGTTPEEPVDPGITLVKADGSAFTSSDIEGGASVEAKAVITMDAAASAYIIIAQYTDNTDTKKMLGTIVMDTVSLSSGDNDVTSTSALTLDANCGYVQAFLWTADGNYKPLLAGVSVSK